MPFYSIIIPTHQRADLLGRCLESVMAQTFDDWDLWIVNDGSTDHTAEIARAYVNDRVHYLETRDAGPAIARNVALERARGEWIAFVDDDDECFPNHLAVRRRIIDENPDVDMIFGGWEIVGDPWIVDAHDTTRLIHSSETHLIASSMFRRTVFEKNGGFHTSRYGGDYDFIMEMEAKGHRWLRTEEKTYRYYRWEESRTGKARKRRDAAGDGSES